VAICVMDPAGSQPFGPSKWAAIGLSIAALFVLGAPTSTRLDPVLRWVGWLGALWLVIATVTGRDLWVALTGTPERRFGLITIFALAWCLVVGVRLSGVEARRSLSWGSAIALVLVDLACVMEWAGHPLVRLASNNGRLVGPFGSAALLGQALVLLVPLSAGCAFDEKSSRIRRGVAGLGLALSPVAIFGSASRAAMLGLSLGALVGTIRWFRQRRTGREWVRFMVIAAAVVAVCVAGFISSPAGERVKNTATSGRIDEWTTGIRAVREAPMFGYGPEGYRIAFPKVVDRSYVAEYGRAVATDRAHSLPIDVALLGGIPLLAMVAAVVVLALVRAWNQPPDALGIAALVAIAGYLAHQMLLFPTTEVDPLFWLLTGITLGSRPRAVAPPPSIRVGRNRPIVAGVALGAVLVVGVLDIAADHRIATALAASNRGDHQAAADAARSATVLRPDSYRPFLALTTVEERHGTAAALNDASEAIASARWLSPEDPVLALREAQVTSTAARLAGDPQLERLALRRWSHLRQSDPLNPNVWMGSAEAAADVEQFSEMNEFFDRAQQLQPVSTEPLVRKAFALIRSGQKSAAATAAEEALRRDPRDSEAARAWSMATEP
jgi:O-antigen ligase